MTLDSSGSPVTVSGVIVLDPVDDSVCNLQCAVGWYDAHFGNAAPFSCAAQTADRTSREGIPKYPISCTSTLLFPFVTFFGGALKYMERLVYIWL